MFEVHDVFIEDIETRLEFRVYFPCEDPKYGNILSLVITRRWEILSNVFVGISL